jgi:RNA polymerase sigma factor (sigma-70 family)
MAAAQLGTVLHHLRRLADRQRTAPLGDAQLLEQFARRRDEAAFAALLERHGPTVLGVCRRILHESHDAEDAFQATFLVFVRKANSIGRAEALGCWLYEVAYRTALRAKHNAARRRTRERQAPRMADTPPPTDLDWSELRPILDEELHRLPDNYRRPFVLCYLEGKTHAEAAEQLDWPKGTVSGRLARARDLFRRRLARHGLILSASALVALLPRQASAAVPARLLNSTHRAGLLTAAGRPAAAFVSAEAVTLAREVALGMASAPLKAALFLLVAVGVCVGLAQVTLSANDRTAVIEQLSSVRGDTPQGLPEGAVARMGGTQLRHGDRIHFVTFTPDGKNLVTAGADQTVRLWNAADGHERRRFDMPETAKDLATPLRLQGGLFLTTLSPDGKLLASARQDSVFLWEVRSGKELHRLRAPRPELSSLAFGDGGKNLVAVDALNAVFTWEVATGKPGPGVPPPNLGPMPKGRMVMPACAISADGKFVALPLLHPQTGKVSVRVLDRDGGKALGEVEAAQSLCALTFSPDCKTLGWGDSQGQVFLRDVPNNEGIAVLPGSDPPRRVLSLSFTPDAKSLAVSREDGSVELWDVAGRRRMYRLTGPSVPVGASVFLLRQGFGRADIAFSADGKRLAVGTLGSRVRLFDTDTGKEVGPGAAGHPDAARTMALSRDGKTLLTHSRGDPVRFWDMATGKEHRHSRMPVDTANAALSPDGSLLAAVSVGKVWLFDPATGQEKGRLNRPWVLGGTPSFSPGGKTLAVRYDQGQVRLWEVTTGKDLPPAQDEVPPRALSTFGTTSATTLRLAEVVLSPDGGLWVAANADNDLALYETETGVRLGEFRQTEGQPVRRATFSPDARSLVTANQDGAVTLYETATLRRRTLFAKAARDFSPTDLALLLSGGRVIPVVGGSETPFAVAFSPGGRVLAANPSRSAIVFWDVLTGKELAAFRGHQGGVVSLRFSADGNRLFSGSQDGTVLVWDTTKITRALPAGERRLDPDAADRLWADLAGADAERAFAAMRELWGAPADAVALLKRLLKPVPAVEPERVTKFIADLDAKNLSTRENAAAELEKLGDLIKAAAREQLAKGSTLETRQRLEKMLDKLRVGAPASEVLTALRGVEVLEHIATPEARQVLRTLAEGAPGTRPTEAARDALRRLDRGG